LATTPSQSVWSHHSCHDGVPGDLHRRARETTNVTVEGWQVIVQQLWRVTLRID
jgi:hypothetical protein